MKYYDEGELAKRLVAAKADWSSSVSVAKLEQALLNSWLAKEKTAEDAFKILRLSDDIGDDILRNPAVTTWYSYVKMRKQNPDELLFFELKKVLSDERLARTLVAAKKKGNAKIDVSVLEVEQFKYWLRGGKSADDIFTLLKLNKNGDKLFESPMLNTWVSYVVKLDEKNADELIFVALKNHYGIESVKEMIVQAKTRVTTENLASKLQEEVWRSTGKTEDDIFNLLKLDKDTLLEIQG
ncbi:Glucan 1 [Phytophthora nicotianae]|uniref:Glucan 1 n=1 Tax=Phytophthora nicotianae TaxID=4792 RepID=A0A0W8DRX3_PHYNI|nr:Glucan 1 [Phytophthora nicotianae]